MEVAQMEMGDRRCWSWGANHDNVSVSINEEQIMNFVSKVLLPLTLSAGGHFLKKKFDQSKDETDLFNEVGIIVSEVKDLLNETNVQRFLMFRSKINEKPRKASCVLEDYRKPFRSVYYDYQNIEADADYTLLLAALEQNEVKTVLTSKLPNNSVLRRIYEAEGVKYSCIFQLHKTKTYLYYASAATNDDIKEYNKATKNKVELTRGKIKGILEKYAV